MTKPRVLILGRFKPDYTRNHVIRVGLERAGVEVTCDVFSTPMTILRRMQGVISRFPRNRQYDVVMVPMSNQLTAPTYWLMSVLYRQPILLDYFLGLTDANEDRQSAKGLRTALYRWVDRFNISNMISITDTAAHRDVYHELTGIMPKKMSVIPVGINDDIFRPVPLHTNPQRTKVQFVGTFIPFQGVDVILRAAALLKHNTSITFELIGTGQTYEDARALAGALGLGNVDFSPYVPYAELPERMRYSAIQLGVFGSSHKTSYVVPNKIYEGLALGLPMITAESPALNEFFEPGRHLLTVPPGDPEALAEAIVRLAKSPSERARLGAAGAARIREEFLPQHIGRRLRPIIEDLSA